MVGYGIHIFDQRRSEDPPGYTRLISDVVVEGNVIWGSEERAGIIVAAYDQAKAQNVVIRNNVIYHHAGNGINVQYDVSDIKVYNNTIYDINADAIAWNGDAGIYVGDGADSVQIVNNLISIKNSGWHVVVSAGANMAVDHNLYWPAPLRLEGISDSNALLADPQFNAVENNDFTLTPTSPAIDAGIEVGLPFAGTAPDMGAYELGLIVPVELASFSFSIHYGNVVLEWETATETNNAGFEVQRSRETMHFEKIGFVHGQGTTATPQRYQYVDKVQADGVYFYRLKQIDMDGAFVFSSVLQVLINKPGRFEVDQNHPNPFNAETRISYAIPVAGRFRVQVFDCLGTEIWHFERSDHPSGFFSMIWNGTDMHGRSVASGPYFYRAQWQEGGGQGRSITRRMTLLH